MNPIFLCHIDDVGELESKGFEISVDNENTLKTVVVKHDGQIYAYLNHCPHLGIELNWQPDNFMSLEGTHIQCATHGALFEPDTGHCIAGPCRGQGLVPLNIHIKDKAVYLVPSATSKQAETD
jgi:nitrite reductase/ring-hydroxylating ferredoxin subunit